MASRALARVNSTFRTYEYIWKSCYSPVVPHVLRPIPHAPSAAGCLHACSFTTTVKARKGKANVTEAVAYKSFTSPDIVKFLDDAYALIKEEAWQKGTDRASPVHHFKQPNELQSILDLEIGKEPADHEAILQEMRKIIQFSVKTGHPHFYNQQFAGIDPYSQVGAWLTDSLNTNIFLGLSTLDTSKALTAEKILINLVASVSNQSVGLHKHTFEVCPVFIVMERYLFGKLTQVVGFKNGDGIFCPGGSASVMLALHLARYKKFPEVKTNGIYGLPRMRCYISEEGHYSLKKGGNYLGFGLDNVILIKTDAKGCMIPEELERQIEDDLDKGYVPLFVMATCGSTVFGSFDALPEISDICQRHGLWLHADACWGGGCLLSQKYRSLLTGVERCDSLAWNFHKFSGVPIQCSALLINDQTLMNEANRLQAEYLFQPDKYYDTSYDVGDKTVQCGRKVDVAKLWLQWKALGDEGMEARINKAFDNAKYLQEKIKTTEGFRLVLPEYQCTNISFWYIPPRLRGQPETEEWWAEIHKVAPQIKKGMVMSGSMMIGYQPKASKGLVNFFRMIIHNPILEHSDMDFVISEIDRLGQNL